MPQMSEEQRKRLEEMAKNQLVEKLVMDNCDTNYFESMFMAGAQAAWEMATKAERERCARIVRESFTGCSMEPYANLVAKDLLHPKDPK